ncbi:sodium-independent sulfate anion transporter-like [Glandiceps talaboti]
MASNIRKGAKTVKEKFNDFVKESCTVENWKQKFPISIWLPKYKPKWVISDCIAGLTVGLTVIPQGLAYATIAKLPVEYGLYSAFMGCIVYCLMGTAKDITLGPTAVMSLMVAEFGGGSGGEAEVHDPIYAITLSFFSGVVLLLMGILHLGFLVNFISFPVINAFTSAAAVIIGVGQLRHIFGIPKFKTHGFMDDVYHVCTGLPQTRWQDFVMGATCFILLMSMKKIKDKCNGKKAKTKAQLILYKIVWLLGTARNAVIVIIAACIAYGIYSHGYEDAFRLVGHVPAGLPQFISPLPPFERLEAEVVVEESNHTLFNQTETDATLSPIDYLSNLTANGNVTIAPGVEEPAGKSYISLGKVLSDINVGLGIIPIIGFLENCAIAKAFARKGNYRVYPNQELLALGSANVMSSFVSAYPVTGSFSRTAVNAQSGVKTPLGGLFTAALVLLSLAFLTPLFYFIPKAALASVIVCAVIAMFDHSTIKKLWVVKKLDLLTWVGTFLGCLWQGVEIGIIIGIAIDLCVLLYTQAKPEIEIVKKEVTVFQIDYGVHYPAVEHISDTIKEDCLSGDNLKSCVADCTRLTFIDYTSIQAMKEMCAEFKRNNVKIVMAGLRPNILDIILRAKIPHFENHDTVDDAIKSILDTADQPEADESHILLAPIDEKQNHVMTVSDGKLENHTDGKIKEGGDAV